MTGKSNQMSDILRLQPMESAPKDRRIVVWTPHCGGTWTGAKWYEDRYAVRPRPYWDVDCISFVTPKREHPPVGWIDLPSGDALSAKEGKAA